MLVPIPTPEKEGEISMGNEVLYGMLLRESDRIKEEYPVGSYEQAQRLLKLVFLSELMEKGLEIPELENLNRK